MFAHARALIVLTGSTVLLGSVVYPVAVYAIGQTFFAWTANGSLITNADGSIIGSRLIAQEFKGDQYLHSRPSAASYNGGASSGSNFGASNPKLKSRVEDQLKAEYEGKHDVPADAVTTSGSGLDPHITLRAAMVQAERIAKARQADVSSVRELITKKSFTPMAGIVGEPLVNVLEVNLALDGITVK